MANCPNCGAPANEDQQVCANCGTALVEVEVQSSEEFTPQHPYGQRVGSHHHGHQQAYDPNQAGVQYPAAGQQGQQPPAPGAYPQQGVPQHGGHALSPEQADIESNKAMAILAYFGLLVLIPIFAAKDSRFARYHANQGLVLLLFAVGYGILVVVLQAVFWSLLFTSYTGFGLYGIMNLLLSLGWIFFLVLAIMGIVHAAKGEYKPLPIIGGITILK